MNDPFGVDFGQRVGELAEDRDGEAEVGEARAWRFQRGSIDELYDDVGQTTIAKLGIGSL